MSGLVEGGEKRQNYSIHVQDNGLTVVENVYGNSANNGRKRLATVVYFFVRSCISSHIEELIAMRKLLK